MHTVFFSYSHSDENLRDELEKQLSILKKQGLIDTWHDRRIAAGDEINQSIDERINNDDIILLLISPDFLSSNYCYEIEMKRAMERHAAGNAIVIPVILRPCDWHPAPFGKLNATPPDGKPITKWADRDEAFLEVAKAIREATNKLSKKSSKTTHSQIKASHTGFQSSAPARSSNLRLAKTFTERDKDHFKIDAFDYMAQYFENSLEELGKRNPDIDGHYRKVNASRFFATIYQHGKAMSRCTIFLSTNSYANGICYTNGETYSDNTLNDWLSVEFDDQSLYLKSSGMSFTYNRNGSNQKLTFEGGSEFFWSLLIQPLQNNRSWGN